MERLLKWLDDFEDLLAVARLQAGPAIVTLLLAAFVVTVGAVFLFGPPELLAAP